MAGWFKNGLSYKPDIPPQKRYDETHKRHVPTRPQTAPHPPLAKRLNMTTIGRTDFGSPLKDQITRHKSRPYTLEKAESLRQAHSKTIRLQPQVGRFTDPDIVDARLRNYANIIEQQQQEIESMKRNISDTHNNYQRDVDVIHGKIREVVTIVVGQRFAHYEREENTHESTKEEIANMVALLKQELDRLKGASEHHPIKFDTSSQTLSQDLVQSGEAKPLQGGDIEELESRLQSVQDPNEKMEDALTEVNKRLKEEKKRSIKKVVKYITERSKLLSIIKQLEEQLETREEELRRERLCSQNTVLQTENKKDEREKLRKDAHGTEYTKPSSTQDPLGNVGSGKKSDSRNFIQEVLNLQQELDMWKKKWSVQAKQCSDYKEIIRNLENEINDKDLTISRQETTISEHETKLDEFEHDIIQLQEDIQSKEKSLSDAMMQNRSMKAKLEELQQLIAVQVKLIEGYKSAKVQHDSDMKSVIARHEKHLFDLRTQMVYKPQETEKSLQNITLQEREHSNMLQKQLNEAQKEIERLQEISRKSETTLKQLETRLQISKSDKQSLKENLEEKLSSNEKVNSSLKELNEKNEEEISLLRQQLDVYERKLEKIKTQRSDQEIANERESKERECEIRQLRSQIHDTEIKNEALRLRMKENEETIQRKEDDLREVRTKSEERASKIQQYRERITEQASKIRELEEDSKHQLQSMEIIRKSEYELGVNDGYEKGVSQTRTEISVLHTKLSKKAKSETEALAKCIQFEQSLKHTEVELQSEREMSRAYKSKLAEARQEIAHSKRKSQGQDDTALMYQLAIQDSNFEQERSKFQRQIKDLQHEVDHTRQQLRELSDSHSQTVNRLAAEMNAKVSSDESALENISIHARPMKIAEEYSLLMSNSWLEAKSALDVVIPEGKMENEKVVLLYNAIMLSQHEAKKLYRDVLQQLEETLQEPICRLIAKEERFPRHEPARGKPKSVKKGMSQNLLTIIGDYFRSLSTTVNLKHLNQRVILALSDQCKHNRCIKAEHLQIQEVSEYIDDIVRVAWKMALQRPPMTFDATQVGQKWKKEMLLELMWGSEPNAPGAIIQYYKGPQLLHAGNVMVKGTVFVHNELE